MVITNDVIDYIHLLLMKYSHRKIKPHRCKEQLKKEFFVHIRVK
jgi:hypothetical protein